jgi:hypothetical protein
LEVLVAVLSKIQVLLDVSPRQLINSYQHCEKTQRFHICVHMSVNIYQSTEQNITADLNLQMEHMSGTTFEAANEICRLKLRDDLDAIC